MQRIESSEFLESEPIRQPDAPVYMAATPTGPFLEYLELLADALFR